MPAVSRSQQQAMAIAEHNPDKLYDRNKGLLKMSHSQLHDFAVGSQSGKPEHVAHHSPPAAYLTQLLRGSGQDIVHSNMNAFKAVGMNEKDATVAAIKKSRGYANQHKNLGKFLHPRKDGKPHGHSWAGPGANDGDE